MPQEFEYFAILTNKGTEKMAAYLQSGKKIEIAFVSVGDGNGQIPMPDPAKCNQINVSDSNRCRRLECKGNRLD